MCFYKISSTFLFTTITSIILAQTNQDFEMMINKAIASGEKNITIPSGTYYLYLNNYKPLTLQHLRNVTIDCNGANIICKKPTQAIQLDDCKNLTLKNLTIDYDPLPFAEGEIVDMDKEKRMWLTVKMYGGYPRENIEKHLPDRFQIFDKHSLELKKNLFTYWSSDFSKVQKLNDSTFIFFKSRFIKESCEEVGDKIVFSIATDGQPTRAHCIVTTKSEAVTFQNITMYASNCFGFFEDECSNNRYDHCVITKNIHDKNVAFPRLRSANADALHSKSAVIGPQVENCTFLYHGDDCIAINSRFYMVAKADANTIYVLAKKEDLKMDTGDTLRFVNADGSIKADAIAADIKEQPGFDSLLIQKTLTLYHKQKMRVTGVTKIILDKKIDSATGTLVYSVSRSGSGFVVRNNHVGFTRARGILIKASNGIIEDNMVEGCELSGIVLSPEMFWMEAGFSRNVSIKNNTIKDCMFANSSYGIEQAAPISVVAINAQGKLAPAGGFDNINIENNTIQNCPLPAILVTSAKDICIRNNTIYKSGIVRTHGQNIGVQNEEVIWIRNGNNIEIKNNKVVRFK